MATEAGQGEHHVYRIIPTGSGDTGKLTAGKHYVGIDAVAWFINKKSTWFTDRISSGTLDIKLASGLEKYQAALGTFELKGGAKYAPVFFIVGDHGHRIGEGTFALGRWLQGMPLVTATRQNIFSAHIQEKDVLWIFFGGEVMSPPYTQATVSAKRLEKFRSWGGEARLNVCLANPRIPVAQ